MAEKDNELQIAEQCVGLFVRAWRAMKPVQRAVKDKELAAMAIRGKVPHGFYADLARQFGIGDEAVRQRRRGGDVRVRRSFRTGK